MTPDAQREDVMSGSSFDVNSLYEIGMFLLRAFDTAAQKGENCIQLTPGGGLHLALRKALMDSREGWQP